MDRSDTAGQHNTSLAVWDLPSAVVIRRSARMKVGAKCSADCPLKDHEIEILNGEGARMARAALSAEPWPGTNGLYWAEVEFAAPAATGTHTWAVTSAHGEGFANFTLITVPPPEHSIAIQVRDQASQAPVSGVEVRVGVYRATTDERGLAMIELPGGHFSMTVWKIGYESLTQLLDVDATTTLEVELPLEPQTEQPYWM